MVKQCMQTRCAPGGNNSHQPQHPQQPHEHGGKCCLNHPHPPGSHPKHGGKCCLKHSHPPGSHPEHGGKCCLKHPHPPGSHPEHGGKCCLKHPHPPGSHPEHGGKCCLQHAQHPGSHEGHGGKCCLQHAQHPGSHEGHGGKCCLQHAHHSDSHPEHGGKCCLKHQSTGSHSKCCFKAKYKPTCPKTYKIPVHMIKSRELRGGVLYTDCMCLRRNGLQHDCKRNGCRNEPRCSTLPAPCCLQASVACGRHSKNPYSEAHTAVCKLR